MKLSVQTFQFRSGPETQTFYACPRHREQLKNVWAGLFYPIGERTDDAADCGCAHFPEDRSDAEYEAEYQNHEYCSDCEVCKGEHGP